MTVLAWEGMLRGDTAYLLKISIYPAKESVEAALEAVDTEALREAYAKHDIPLEALEGGLEALEELARVYELW